MSSSGFIRLIMPDLIPDEIASLSTGCIRASDADAELAPGAMVAGASAYYQVGVERHRRLFLSEQCRPQANHRGTTASEPRVHNDERVCDELV
jgi:hypothetical protein